MTDIADRQPEETDLIVTHPVEAVLLDIEGTVTPISLVRDSLFPYARARLVDFVAEHGDDPAVQSVLAQTRELEPEADPVAALLRWSDLDQKVTPLKTIQGLIWREGYAAGDLIAQFYPEVPDMLSFWKREGLPLYVYSSGSEEAQRGIFGHSQAGDLVPLFSGFYDTRIGPKRERESYDAIRTEIGLPAGLILFLSDVEAELDAAAAAGFRTCQIVRDADGTLPSTRHPVAPDLHEVSRLFTLPQSA
ncbi:acireductone synthase [Acidisoma cellulosilytica]|uniref:Enolase-phosphatase E1 n=1 Tax=Acidisoma cellulosilyticum TaxID=2802395 RepID=A0A963YYI4_9PROT|nr:acireductone synthase [Acidisoma cellulosilyticum]MCB8879144.1 acireductone synthase [Acidisoma cellulosilyticum]